MTLHALRVAEGNYLIDDVNLDDKLSQAEDIFVDTNHSGTIDASDDEISHKQFQNLLAEFGVKQLRGRSLFALAAYLESRQNFVSNIDTGQVENLFADAKNIIRLGLDLQVPKRELMKFVGGINAAKIYYDSIISRVEALCLEIRAGRDDDIAEQYAAIMRIIRDCDAWHGTKDVLGRDVEKKVNRQIALAYADGAVNLTQMFSGYTAVGLQRPSKLREKYILIKMAVEYRINNELWSALAGPAEAASVYDDDYTIRRIIKELLAMAQESLAANELEVALIEIKTLTEFDLNDEELGRFELLTDHLVYKTRELAIRAIHEENMLMVSQLERVLTDSVDWIGEMLNTNFVNGVFDEIMLHKKIAAYNQVEPTIESREEFVTGIAGDLSALKKAEADLALSRIRDNGALSELKKKVAPFTNDQLDATGSGGKTQILRGFELPQ